MARWAPGAQVRLEQAALALFGERGYEATTVAGIAERAGLTERTFYRYFADKREVLFFGASALTELLVQQVESAPVALAPLEVVAAALDAAAVSVFSQRQEPARARQAVIAANPELRERELIKLAGLAAALADALRRRGVAEPAASLAAETGIAIFRIAFDAWATDAGGPTLSAQIRATVEQMQTVTGGRPPSRRLRASAGRRSR